MYAKLAFKNIRRSLRDYIIYFVTITLTAALMYVFLALGFSQDIIAMSENMSMLTSGILILSVLIAFMTSFVIGYAIRFMLGQRKKELATYELMGMESKQCAICFWRKHDHWRMCIFVGLTNWNWPVWFTKSTGKNIFDVPHTYRVFFSFQAWAITFLFLPDVWIRNASGI